MRLTCLDSSKVDFTNPESFFHDVNSVAGLLKQFFRELPDPLFTRQYYNDFINAARELHLIIFEKVAKTVEQELRMIPNDAIPYMPLSMGYLIPTMRRYVLWFW